MRARELSHAEKVALVRWLLGGAEALRTPSYTAACSTVASLVRRGLLGKHDLTDHGRKLAQELREDVTP